MKLEFGKYTDITNFAKKVNPEMSKTYEDWDGSTWDVTECDSLEEAIELNNRTFRLHLFYYVLVILVSVLLCSTAKAGEFPHWKAIFGFGIFAILMAVVGVLISVKSFTDDEIF